MRIYKNFKEAVSEITRDVKEMGHRVHTYSYQDQVIKDDPLFETLEVSNYIYTVTGPDLEDLDPVQPWADQEFAERVSGYPLNPGEAWKERETIWREFLHNGKLSYNYYERMYVNINMMMAALKHDNMYRQLFLSIWKPGDIRSTGGAGRIPCTLGYLFQYRQEKLNITYLQRSADLATHLINDMYLACRLQHWIAKKLEVEVGTFTHWLGSLHVFQKDVADVF